MHCSIFLRYLWKATDILVNYLTDVILLSEDELPMIWSKNQKWTLETRPSRSIALSFMVEKVNIFTDEVLVALGQWDSCLNGGLSVINNSH